MKKKKKKRRLYPIALILLQFHANVTALVAGFLSLQFMTPGLQALEWGQREPFLFLSLSISFKQQFLKSFSYLKGNFAAKKSKSICSFIIRHIFSEASGGPAYTYKSSASQWVRKKKKTWKNWYYGISEARKSPKFNKTEYWREKMKKCQEKWMEWDKYVSSAFCLKFNTETLMSGCICWVTAKSIHRCALYWMGLTPRLKDCLH